MRKNVSNGAMVPPIQVICWYFKFLIVGCNFVRTAVTYADTLNYV